MSRAPRAAPVCLVSHDGHRHGAQLLMLEIARIWARELGLDLHIVLLGPGPLRAKFARYGRVIRLDEQDVPRAARVAANLARLGVRRALCGSVATGLFVETLARADIRSVVLAHELPAIIAERTLGPHIDAIRAYAQLTVFPSTLVRDRFPGGAPTRHVIHVQGVIMPIMSDETRATGKRLRARLRLPEDAPLVLNVAYGDRRKGVDLFVAIGALTMARHPRVRFVWVGDVEPAMAGSVTREVRASGFGDRFLFLPFQTELTPFYAIADVFALTSREDPFPSVLVQALGAGVPAVAFSGAGGYEASLRDGVRYVRSNDAFAEAILELLADSPLHAETAAAARAAVQTGYSMQAYARDMAALLDAPAAH